MVVVSSARGRAGSPWAQVSRPVPEQVFQNVPVASFRNRRNREVQHSRVFELKMRIALGSIGFVLAVSAPSSGDDVYSVEKERVTPTSASSEYVRGGVWVE